jgi:CheY-like chemotaxis protein
MMGDKADDCKHILVVDDDSDTLELLCTLLRTDGYAVVGVPDANAAVESVKERVPDMLLIDYMLPETDGMTTLQHCRAQPGGRDVRAVMLTADSRLATLERALALGFDEFLPKPILDQAEFLQRINDVLTRRR